MAETFEAVVAKAEVSMKELLGSSKLKLSSELQRAYAATYGEAALQLRLDMEVKYPKLYNGDYLPIIQLKSVIQELSTLLYRYGQRARYYMAKPTEGWKNRPTIHVGLPGVPNLVMGGKRATHFTLLSASDWSLATGAYVSATQLHSASGEARSANDANWHYIWTNNGVKGTKRGGRYVLVQDRPSRSGKGEAAMSFRVPYNRATQPKSLRGGSHSSGDIVVLRKRAIRKVEARNFTGQVAELLQRTFAQDALRAIEVGISRYQESAADRAFKNG